MPFLQKALRFKVDDLVQVILGLPEGPGAPNPNTGVRWAPIGVVWHNTAQPDITEWTRYTDGQKESFGDNLNGYYRRMGWHSGPHLLALPEGWAFQLCDLTADGIHDSCRNSNYFGIETCGNFAPGGNDASSGLGALAIKNAATLIAALCKRFGWDPEKQIDFHRNCKADNHACPGAQITDLSGVALAKECMSALSSRVAGGEGRSSPLPPSGLRPEPTPLIPTIILPAWPPAGDEFFKLAARVWNEARLQGAPIGVANAICATGEAECSLNVALKGDLGEAHGLCQWHEPRVTAIRDATGIDVASSGQIEDHVLAMIWEMRNKFPDVWKAAVSAPSAEAAAQIITKDFEKAGAPAALQRRGRMAERWAALWASPDGAALLKANPPLESEAKP